VFTNIKGQYYVAHPLDANAKKQLVLQRDPWFHPAGLVPTLVIAALFAWWAMVEYSATMAQGYIGHEGDAPIEASLIIALGILAVAGAGALNQHILGRLRVANIRQAIKNGTILKLHPRFVEHFQTALERHSLLEWFNDNRYTLEPEDFRLLARANVAYQKSIVDEKFLFAYVEPRYFAPIMERMDAKKQGVQEVHSTEDTAFLPPPGEE
jgi:hypothetical protein